VITKHGKTILFSVAASVAVIPSAVYADTSHPHYGVVDTLRLPGAVRWDFLTFDPDHHRLFITRGESVDVFDVTTKKITGSISRTSGVHGVALAPELGRGFTSNGSSNDATVFDLTTLQPIATIPTGTKPDTIVYDALTQRVFTANAGSGDLTVIDVKQSSVLNTVKLDGKPEFAVVDGKGHLYVNLEDTSQMDVVDTKDPKVVSRFELAPSCDGPTGLSIDQKLNRLFVSCHNKKMLVVDAGTGKIIDALPIGGFSDATIFDPGTNLAFSSNSDGTLDIIAASGPNRYAVIQTAKTLPLARTMALDPTTHHIYLVTAETDGFDPPTPERPHPRPHMKADSFMILTASPDDKTTK
jgi:YVTN family beta-propeller protein